MLISPAWADAAATATATTAAGAPPEGSVLMQFMPLIVIFVIFYFLLIRPQQKRIREQQTMLSNIRKGDRVVTGGGIIGTVTKDDGEELQVEIADNVRVKVQRSSIATVVAKTEPANDTKAAYAVAAAIHAWIELPVLLMALGQGFSPAHR